MQLTLVVRRVIDGRNSMPKKTTIIAKAQPVAICG
jgi:hypothetical protein